jgi:TonB family protein
MNVWAKEMLLWSWQSLLLVGLIFLLIRILRSRSAVVRHSFWQLGLLAIALLPLANSGIRALPVYTPKVLPTGLVAELVTVEAVAAPASQQTRSSLQSVTVPALFALWAGGVLICAGRVCKEYRRLWRSRSRGRRKEITDSGVPVFYADAVKTPVLVGFFRPTILLPEDIDNWTTAEERRAIVLHELAHLQRRDHWMSPVHALLGAVFFFHPAVRYALRQLILERELACDEHVLAAGASPRLYAEIILKVAQRNIPGQLSNCPTFNPSGKALERRVEMILKHQSSKTLKQRRLPAVVRATVVLSVAALLLPERAVTAQIQTPPAQNQEYKVAAQEVRPGAAQVVLEIRAEATTTTAQAPVTPILGTVYDQTGAVIPGVNVELSTGATLRQSVVTNESGAFSFPRVDPGRYTLQARLPGFQTASREVSLRQGTSSNFDILLVPGRISTAVEVTAAKPVTSPPPGNQQPGVRLNIRRVGGVVAAPNLISAPKPVYPPFARENQVQGLVILQGVIGKDGTVLSLQPDTTDQGSGNPGLIAAAMDAVRQWRYSPAMLNGTPVDFPTTITVDFRLVD